MAAVAHGPLHAHHEEHGIERGQTAIGRVEVEVRGHAAQVAEGFAKEETAYARDNGDNVIPLPVKNGKKQSPFGQGAESTPHQVLKDMIK